MEQQLPIQAVIFDLDDTLLDWAGAKVQWEEMSRNCAGNLHTYLTAQGHHLPAKSKFANMLNKTIGQVWQESAHSKREGMFVHILRRCLDKCGLEDAGLEMPALMRAYNWQPIPGVERFPDTIPVLNKLKTDGYKLGLITNAFQSMWMRDVEIKHYGLTEYLPYRLTAGDVGHPKPHPAIYHQMLDQMQISPQQAVFVGDTLNQDILGANKVGMTSVWMKLPHAPELNGVQPDYTIHNLSELLPIINSE